MFDFFCDMLLLRYVIISVNVSGAMTGFVGLAPLFKKSLIFIVIQYVCVV